MVVGKDAATVMTSSPGFIARSPNSGAHKPEMATRLADEPELTVSANFTPIKRASSLSNLELNLPVVNQASRAESTMYCSSV